MPRCTSIAFAVAWCSLIIVPAALASPVVNGDVTAPGDPIVGVAATVGAATSSLAAPGGVVGSGNAYPNSESPSLAIDNVLTDKYLNFGKAGVGFITTTTTSGPSTVVKGIRFTTATDHPERDPTTVTLEGSQDANATSSLNSSWTLIYNGPSGLSTDPGRFQVGPQVNFANGVSFKSYRLLVSSVRDAALANSMQFGEVELIGNTVVPEPTSLAAAAIALSLAGRRRRFVA